MDRRARAARAARARAETLSGKVVSIADGDSFTVLVERERVKVRLAEIDAPERGQPWSRRAKQALARKLAGCTVAGRDGFQRSLRRRVGHAAAAAATSIASSCARDTPGCTGAGCATRRCSTTRRARAPNAWASGDCPKPSALPVARWRMRRRRPSGGRSLMSSCEEARFRELRTSLNRWRRRWRAVRESVQ